jgi:hypothetical protein
MGRDLPDADGPGFLALNGSFQAENQSLIGHILPVAKRPSMPAYRPFAV